MVPRPNPSRSTSRRGFTLAELVVVIAVLGVTAALGLPRFAAAESVDHEARLGESIRDLRRAVTVYTAQHNDVPPGHPDGRVAASPTADALIAQLTGWTDADGRATQSAHNAFRFGPYLRAIPLNVVSELSTVRFVAPGRPIDTPMDVAGWVYQPNTLTIAPDTSGRDDRGVRYFDY